MNGPWTASRAPAGHRSGLRGRLLLGVAVKPCGALLGAILALAFLASPVPSPGEQPAKVYRMGWLASGRSPKAVSPENCPLKGSLFWQTWVQEMRQRGYIHGQNLVVECQYTEGRDERAPALAAELVSRKVDLIVAIGTNQVRAAKQATSTIPIVMRGVIDPVGRGLVASLAHPGGNVTGLADDAGLEILGKYLDLLTEAVPTASRIATLRPPSLSGEPPSLAWASMLETEARALGVTLQSYRVRGPEELEGAFAGMTKARAEALLVVPHPLFGAHAQRIVDLAAQSRLPAMYPDGEHVTLGGLMAYAVDELDMMRRLGPYVDRILKGANPGDLPVEQPTRFLLILNLKTAKALGLTIPRALLMQADEVIR